MTSENVKANVLVIDLDRTLSKVDILAEWTFSLFATRPLEVIKALKETKGRLEFKKRVASFFKIHPDTVPLNKDVVALAHEYKRNGGKLVLATGSLPEIVFPMAGHLAIFDEVICSERLNLKGDVKADELARKFGVKGFDYVGDSIADVPVWQASNLSYVVAPHKKRRRLERVHNLTLIPISVPEKRLWIRSMRPNHWVKNLLVFLPLVLSADLSAAQAFWRLIALAIALSLMASSLYIFNDLLDLESDRLHSSKRNRPSASGDLNLVSGIFLSLGFAAIALLIGVFGSGLIGFATVAAYGIASYAYSMFLKKIPLVDLVALSSLYVYRIMIGGWVGEVKLSSWLLFFTFLVFLSLASIKRITELQEISNNYPPTNSSMRTRGYIPSDIQLVLPLGIAFSISALTVLMIWLQEAFLELSQGLVAAHLLIPLATVWFMTLWLDVLRGRVGHDPVRYVYKDWKLVLLLAVMASLYLAERMM